MGNVFAGGGPQPQAPSAPDVCHVRVLAGVNGTGVSSFVYAAASGEFKSRWSLPAFERIQTCFGTELWLWDDPTRALAARINVPMAQYRVEQADVLALAVDLAETRPEQVALLRNELRKHRTAYGLAGAPLPPIVLLGLKADLPRPQTDEWGALAAELGAVAFVCTSARTGEGVTEAVAAFARCSPAMRRRLQPRLALIWCQRQGVGKSGFAQQMGRLPEHLFRRVALFV